MEESVRIFVSYRHKKNDERYRDEILDYMRAEIKRNGGEFWIDQDLEVGDLWNQRIREKLQRADIVLALVSQYYLSSPYITNVEISTFLERRKTEGLLIFPVILSPCLWEKHGWLAETQFYPPEGRTIEENYQAHGKRMRLYREMTQSLIQHVKRIKLSRQDRLALCPACGAANLLDPGLATSADSFTCKNCDQLFNPLRIKIGDRIVVLNSDTQLYPYHFGEVREADFSRPVAAVNYHPEMDLWGLKNLSDHVWEKTNPDGTSREVPRGSSVSLKVGMKIDFGKKNGVILGGQG